MEDKQTNWLDIESAEITMPTGERLPAMKFLDENKVEEIMIDFSIPFNKYTDTTNANKNVVKAMIPVVHNGEKKIWWLNKRNPAYSDIIKAGKAGQIRFKIMRIGTAANTRYVFVK